ncbi:hypothetical protein CR513_36117, partial [Mucuna pruriens]
MPEVCRRTQSTPRKVARNHLAMAVLQMGGGYLRWITSPNGLKPTQSPLSLRKVKKFLWKKIIYRFGLPAEIVSDNGTQFASKTTIEFCKGLGIKQIFTSTNGQAEVANKVILKGLRRRLEEAKG